MTVKKYIKSFLVSIATSMNLSMQGKTKTAQNN